MKPCTALRQFILLVTWVASGICWSLPRAEYEPNYKIARDPQSVSSSTNTSSIITPRTVKLSKEINTVLGCSVFLLTVATYWLLMRYTTILSNEIILPSKLLQDNITAILSVTWPKHYIGSSEETVEDYKFPWVLFHMKHTKVREETGSYNSKKPILEVLGSHELKVSSASSQSEESSIINVKCFSPVMKSLVQIAIWNYFSLWLVLTMIITTLVYNGFFSHSFTNDSIIRLVLISVYALANFGHQYCTSILIYRNFTFILFQSCWIILCWEFIFLDYRDYDFHTMRHGKRYRDRLFRSTLKFVWTTFSLELFGATERSDTYRLLIKQSDKVLSKGPDGVYSLWSDNDKRRDSHLKAQETIESKLDKIMKTLREAEIKVYEKATDSVLEKVLANVFVLLGICLATTLAPWTSFQTTNATTAQLGSYALLISTSTGLLALVSSITQLTNATESAKTLLRLQEKSIEPIIAIHEDENISRNMSFQTKPKFSFSKGIAGESRLTAFGLWRSASLLHKLLCLLLGPALMLIPRFHRDRRKLGDEQQELAFTVHGINFRRYVPGFDFGPTLHSLNPSRPPPDENHEPKEGESAR